MPPVCNSEPTKIGDFRPAPGTEPTPRICIHLITHASVGIGSFAGSADERVCKGVWLPPPFPVCRRQGGVRFSRRRPVVRPTV